MTNLLSRAQNKAFNLLVLANLILSLLINYSNLRLASVDLLGALIVVIGISIDSYDWLKTHSKLNRIAKPVFYSGVLIRLMNLVIWAI